jgi:hypothetical protein
MQQALFAFSQAAKTGLPDGIFSNKKIPIWVIF